MRGYYRNVSACLTCRSTVSEVYTCVHTVVIEIGLDVNLATVFSTIKCLLYCINFCLGLLTYHRQYTQILIRGSASYGNNCKHG
jgi:hypothetical protein